MTDRAVEGLVIVSLFLLVAFLAWLAFMAVPVGCSADSGTCTTVCQYDPITKATFCHTECQ